MAMFTILVCESLTSLRAWVIYINIVRSLINKERCSTQSGDIYGGSFRADAHLGGQVQNAYITIKLATVAIFSRIHGAGQIPALH